MKISINKSILASAVTLGLGMGVANNAHANAYAVSALNLNNIVITTTPFVAVGTTTDTSQTTAFLNGASQTGGGPGNLSSVANAPSSTVTRGVNDFTIYGQTAGSYSNGATDIPFQQVLGNPFTQTVNIGETNLAPGAHSGSTNTENSSLSDFTTFFTVAAGGTVFTIDFWANLYMQSSLTADLAPGSKALGTVNAVLEMQDVITGSTIFRYSPSGNISTDSVGGTGILDPFSLNRNNGASAIPQTSTFDPTGTGFNSLIGAVGAVAPGFREFKFMSNAIGPGQYSLSLSAKTTTLVTRTVPEPAPLALIGMGLLGMGALRRRTKNVVNLVA